MRQSGRTRGTAGLFILLIAVQLSLFAAPSASGDIPVQLLEPGKDREIIQGPVVFSWTHASSGDVRYYEIKFWSERGRFSESFTVFPSDSSRDMISLKFENARKLFRRHGKYSWRVIAYPDGGEPVSSGIRHFTVGLRMTRPDFGRLQYDYAVQFEYNHRVRTGAFKAFLETADPDLQLRSFGDVGLIFRQAQLIFPFLEMEEKFFALSHVGLGVEATSRWHMYRNRYIAFAPRVGGSVATLSRGLREYMSTLYHVEVGCDFSFMPRGYVTVSGSWIPVYDIRYTQDDGDLRTFQGKGWETGIRVILSRNVIEPFPVFGLEIDFRRIPLAFHFGQVEDSYTGTPMKTRRVSITYLF